MERINDRLLNWASVLDEQTRSRQRRPATMPFVFPHVALMPDAHLGLGATVGSVIPTLRAVMPAAVGVDIGCGMIAVRTQFVAGDLAAMARLAALRRGDRARGAAVGGWPQLSGSPDGRGPDRPSSRSVREASSRTRGTGSWREQLGSLGSGNHFIEVSLDELDRVWLFLHSGSRGRRQPDRPAPHRDRPAI